MTIMASSIVTAVALRRSAASYKNRAYKPMNILLNDKKWASSCRRSFSICSTGSELIKNDLQNNDDDTLICKEDFEVGSRLVSFTTGYKNKKMNIAGRRIKYGMKPDGEVVMEMEDTKIVSAVEAANRTDGLPPRPHSFVFYDEYPFLDAQKAIHTAQQKKFPSHALMGRPSVFGTNERSDIIERSIGRLFPPGYDYVHLSIDVLKSEGHQDPIIMAANTISAALMVSNINWCGPVGFVRIGRIRGSEDGLVINPTMDQIINEGLDLNLVYACTRDRTLMVELEACEVSDRDVEAALRLAHQEAVKYIEPQIRLAARAGIQKKDYKLYMITDQSRRLIENKVLAEPRIEAALFGNTTTSANPNHELYVDKFKRKQVLDEIKRDVEEAILGEDQCSHHDADIINVQKEVVSRAVDAMMRNVVGRLIIEKGLRVDGRHLDQVREPQYCKSGSLPVHYGSSMFWIGHDEVLCSVRLFLPNKSYDDYSSDDDELEAHNMYFRRLKFHFSDEADLLDESAKKAFLAVLPPEDDFPYNVGAFVRVMASTGSSTPYMASVCGASLALMDAGIPLQRHVAGVSMGLVSSVDPSTGMIKDHRILTDIDDDLEMGDMNLKIGGTRKGVTAIQLDIKNPPVAAEGAASGAGVVGMGIPLDIICECLEPASKARLQVLEHMEREIDAPRRSSPNFIQNGWNWRIRDDFSSSFDDKYLGGFYSMDSLRSLQLMGPPAVDDQAGLTSKEEVQQKVIDKFLKGCGLKVGGIYEGVVFLIREEHGAFVKIQTNSYRIGFLHISEMLHNDDEKKISERVSVGQRLSVMCIGYDTRGFLNLSLKTTEPAPK